MVTLVIMNPPRHSTSSDPVRPDQILDAFESLLLEVGPRKTTLDAVAERVRLSRSGVLHHFRSRRALVEALFIRLERLVTKDVEKLHLHGDSAVEFYIRSSLEVDSAVERTIKAVSKLAMGQDAQAKITLQNARSAWFEALCSHVPNKDLVKLAMFIGDGMSYNVEMSEHPEQDEFVNPSSVDAVLSLVNSLRRD